MKIKQAQFLISAPKLAECPALGLPEFALLGRSNVGKSSFINCLVNNSKLAKTSNTPGKTRLINLFKIVSDKGDFVIADLPGYGYAKVSKTEQERWQRSLEEYLLKRDTLKCCIQFIDARHPIQNNDFQMYDWLKIKTLPVVAVLNKCDYVSKNEAFKRQKEIERLFNIPVYPFSAKLSTYKDGIIKFFEENIL